jgi:SAM-dependent methyltransferase
MAEQWFAPHAAGFGPLVLRLVERDFPGCLARAEGDNAIRLAPGPMERGDAASRLVAAPRALLAYCRGLFRVIAEAPGGLERASRSIARDPRTQQAIEGAGPRIGRLRGPFTFVLRAFGPDDPASLPFDIRRNLESAIARATGLHPDSALARRPGRPDREFRVQERADGMALFLEREIMAPEPPARPGELPRTTCRLLAEMTEPRRDDVFLDPFCGYGGIALERALAAPYRFVFASDGDVEKVAAVKAALSGKAFERRRKTIFPKVRDALDGTAFDAGFVTAIATDPPWGLYEGGVAASEAETLLLGFLSEAARLLAPGGRLALLVARGATVDPGSAFARRERLDVLVSGKKAIALRLERI